MTREKVTVSMQPALAEAARNLAEASGLPLSAVIQRLLENWIAEGGALPARPAVVELSAQPTPAAAPKKGGRTRKPKK